MSNYLTPLNLTEMIPIKHEGYRQMSMGSDDYAYSNSWDSNSNCGNMEAKNEAAIFGSLPSFSSIEELSGTSHNINNTQYNRYMKNTTTTDTDAGANASAAHARPSALASAGIKRPCKNYYSYNTFNKYNKYDAIKNCKSAGIIPYAIVSGVIYFLFQKQNDPIRKKDSGWNDFGGKKSSKVDTTSSTAAREFSEETSCLFYLIEKDDVESKKMYEEFKNNDDLVYGPETIDKLKETIPLSQKYFSDKIDEYLSPVYISSKETYISYFVQVKYISDRDIPTAEDIHVYYETRYIRTCKWFSFSEIMKLDEKDFHKRLQITKIQTRIKSYVDKDIFN